MFVYYKRRFDGAYAIQTSAEEPPRKSVEGVKQAIKQVTKLPQVDHYRTLAELEILYPLKGSHPKRREPQT